MVAPILAMRESGPWVLIRSVNNPKDPLPDNGRISAKGRFSGGNPIRVKTGERKLSNKSRAPEARNMPIATSIATRYGIILTEIVKPSFAPSTKVSYTFTFLKTNP